MRTPHVNDWVCLTQDIPELALAKGEAGIVRSTWCAPYDAFEVEFRPAGQRCQTRCLLAGGQVVVREEPGANA